MMIYSLESNTTCNYNTTSASEAEFSCNCSFSGFWIPTMQWTHKSNVTSSSTSLIINNTLTSLSFVKRNLSILVQHDEIFECRTFFTSQNKPNKILANNVPDYLHICTVVVAWPLINKTTNHDKGKYILYSRYLNMIFFYIIMYCNDQCVF